MDKLRTMIKNLNPNPFDVLGLRKVGFAEPHFEYVNVPMIYNLERSLAEWISKNLKHKFYVGRTVVLDHDNKIVQVVTVGFEESKDASYFMLACPYLKYK